MPPQARAPKINKMPFQIMGAGTNLRANDPDRDVIVAHYDSDNDLLTDSAEDDAGSDSENVDENQNNRIISQENKKPLLAAIGNIHRTYLLNLALYPMIINSLRHDQSMDVSNIDQFNLLFYIGTLVGVLLSVPLKSYKLSRKAIISLALKISLIGWIAMFFAKTYNGLARCRCIIGIALGLYSVSFCFYIREFIFSTKTLNLTLHRTNFDFTLEIALTLFVGLGTHWRNVILTGIVYHIYTLLRCLPAIPYSTHFLIRKGDDALAQQSLERIVEINDLPAGDYLPFIKSLVQEAVFKENRGFQVDIPIPNIFIFMFSEVSEVLIYSYLITKTDSLIVIFLVAFLSIIEKICPGVYGPNCIMLMTLLKGLITCYRYDVLDTVNLAIQSYFIMLYAGGWVTGYPTLLQIRPYYKLLPIVPVALFLKYLLALIISLTCGSLIFEASFFPTVYSIVIILAYYFYTK